MQTYGVTYEGVVPGPVNAECVLHIPDSDWLITSSLHDPEQQNGFLYILRTTDRFCTTVFPDNVEYAHDDCTYDPSLPVPKAGQWQNHGMAIKRGPDGLHTLAVVNHNVDGQPEREAVEMFELWLEADTPRLRHVGTVLMPEDAWPTDLALLPGDGRGFVVNSLFDPRWENPNVRLRAAELIGRIFTWTPEDGWVEVPGGPFAGPNGIEISPDGKHVFAGCWPSREVLKIARDGSEPVAVAHANGVLLDNFTWTDHGTLLNAGHLTDPEKVHSHFEDGALVESNIPWAVVEVDPETLQVVTLAGGSTPEGWGMGTSAVQVGDEIWVGSARAKGLALLKRR